MGKLTSFTFISLNGCYKSADGNINWHRHGEEEKAFSESNIEKGNTLLFGRVTYEMMAGFWPSSFALETNPVVAKGMNEAEKIVFSTTLKSPSWNNTTVLSEDIVEKMISRKRLSEKDMTLLGSGSILSLFAEAGIIDEYQFMVDPVIINPGISIFNTITGIIELELTSSRTFRSGVVLVQYKPR